MKGVKTLLDIRIAPGIQGVPAGQIKLVKGEHTEGEEDGTIDYAILTDGKYLGSFDAATEQEAVGIALTKVQELLVLLSK